MKKIVLIIIIFLIIIAVLVIGFAFWGETEVSAPGGNEDEGSMVACAMDAKLCPDGSYVGRIPPDCDFAPCPEE